MFKRQKHLVIREIGPEDAIYSMMTIKKIFLMVSVCKPSWLSNIYIYIYIYIYIFQLKKLAALGLCCCTQAFSRCTKRGLLLVAVHRLTVLPSLVVKHRLQEHRLQQLQHAGSRARGLQQLWHTGSVVVALGLQSKPPQLWCPGSVAPGHVEPSQTRD